jgi:hypothetical protein
MTHHFDRRIVFDAVTGLALAAICCIACGKVPLYLVASPRRPGSDRVLEPQQKVRSTGLKPGGPIVRLLRPRSSEGRASLSKVQVAGSIPAGGYPETLRVEAFGVLYFSGRYRLSTGSVPSCVTLQLRQFAAISFNLQQAPRHAIMALHGYPASHGSHIGPGPCQAEAAPRSSRHDERKRPYEHLASVRHQSCRGRSERSGGDYRRARRIERRPCSASKIPHEEFDIQNLSCHTSWRNVSEECLAGISGKSQGRRAKGHDPIRKVHGGDSWCAQARDHQA